MKILLTGARGQLAQAFMHSANKRHDIHAYTQAQLDITKRADIKKILLHLQPDIVINTAAYTQVDLAEKNPALAFLVNHTGAQYLAENCHDLQIPLIHFSTDYVFSGEQSSPYFETDAPNPLSVYGESKLAGEQAIQACCEKHLIIRVSGIFSAYKINFVKKILEIGQQKKILSIVNDQFLCPTAASDIANMLLILCTTHHWGLYHYCSSEIVSWFQFTKTIFEFSKKFSITAPEEIKGIPSIEYPTPAKRPAYSALNCDKIFQHLHITQPHWRESLKSVLAELL